jgi:hypothetical protein
MKPLPKDGMGRVGLMDSKMGECEGNALFNKLVLVKLWILSIIFQSTGNMDS